MRLLKLSISRFGYEHSSTSQDLLSKRQILHREFDLLADSTPSGRRVSLMNAVTHPRAHNSSIVSLSAMLEDELPDNRFLVILWGSMDI